VQDAGQRCARREDALEQESPCDAVDARAVAQPVCAHQARRWEGGRLVRGARFGARRSIVVVSS
jgi:hypothetical protein